MFAMHPDDAVPPGHLLGAGSGKTPVADGNRAIDGSMNFFANHHWRDAVQCGIESMVDGVSSQLIILSDFFLLLSFSSKTCGSTILRLPLFIVVRAYSWPSVGRNVGR
jgi:hypothetical protein